MNQSVLPMVSVIVPVYNAAGQIERCVQSIAKQTVRQIEIILVDDGSKDQSLALCRKLAEKDDRITVIANMYRDNSPLSRTERCEVFQQLMGNEELCGYLREVQWKSPLMKLFRYEILRKNAWLAEREYALIFFARHHARKLYGFIQNRF